MNQKKLDKGGRREIVIERRYEGPPNIAHGGYTGGVMAECLDCETVEVTMRKPTPMDKPLILDASSPEAVFLYDGETLLNEAKPSDLELDLPEIISIDQARKASLRHVTEMPYPNCFGCGSGRSETDGLHLRSGPVGGRDLVAIDWVPPAAVAGVPAGRDLPKRLAWAAMECPCARAMELGGLRQPDELIVLGRLTTRVKARPKVGRPCFFMAWPIGREGRKIELAGTMHDESGRVLVMSRFTFITLKPGVTYESFTSGAA